MMAAAGPQTTFRATDNIRVTEHGRNQFNERKKGNFQGEPEDAWRQAHTVPWGVFNAVFVRYHVETDLLLVVIRNGTPSGAQTFLVTCLKREFKSQNEEVKRVHQAVWEADN